MSNSAMFQTGEKVFPRVCFNIILVNLWKKHFSPFIPKQLLKKPALTEHLQLWTVFLENVNILIFNTRKSSSIYIYFIEFIMESTNLEFYTWKNQKHGQASLSAQTRFSLGNHNILLTFLHRIGPLKRMFLRFEIEEKCFRYKLKKWISIWCLILKNIS